MVITDDTVDFLAHGAWPDDTCLGFGAKLVFCSRVRVWCGRQHPAIDCKPGRRHQTQRIATGVICMPLMATPSVKNSGEKWTSCRVIKEVSHMLPASVLKKGLPDVASALRGHPQLITPFVKAMLKLPKDRDDAGSEGQRARISATDLSSLANDVNRALDWSLWILCGGDPGPSLKAAVGDCSGGVCGVVWGKNEIAYRCSTCSLDSTCAICVACFLDGNHEGHDYAMIHTGGGCCDCGDPTAWKVDGFCRKHNGPHSTPPLPATFVATAEPALAGVLQVWEAWVEKLIASGNEKPHKPDWHIAVVFTQACSDWLLRLCSQGDSLLKLVAHCFCDGHQNLTKGLMENMSNIPPSQASSVTSLFFKLLGDPDFKYQFATIFVQLYPALLHSLLQEQEHRELDDMPLENFSVQLFTVPTLTPRLVKEAGLLDILLNTLCTLLSHGLGPDGRLKCEATVVSGRHYYRVGLDLRYTLTHVEAARHGMEVDSPYLGNWLRILSMVQGMNPQHREARFHVTYEDVKWTHAFYLVGHLVVIHRLLVAGICGPLEGSDAWVAQAARGQAQDQDALMDGTGSLPAGNDAMDGPGARREGGKDGENADGLAGDAEEEQGRLEYAMETCFMALMHVCAKDAPREMAKMLSGRLRDQGGRDPTGGGVPDETTYLFDDDGGAGVESGSEQIVRGELMTLRVGVSRGATHGDARSATEAGLDNPGATQVVPNEDRGLDTGTRWHLRRRQSRGREAGSAVMREGEEGTAEQGRAQDREHDGAGRVSSGAATSSGEAGRLVESGGAVMMDLEAAVAYASATTAPGSGSRATAGAPAGSDRAATTCLGTSGGSSLATRLAGDAAGGGAGGQQTLGPSWEQMQATLLKWVSMPFDVSREPVSFHLPMHRLLALLLNVTARQAPVWGIPLQGLLPPPMMSHVGAAALLENPLRLAVLCAQVNAGMWRRNGMSIVEMQALYNSVDWCEGSLELDLFVTQWCAVVLPPDQFVRQIVRRFGLSSFFTLDGTRYGEGYEPALAEDMLSLLLRVTGERMFCGLDARAAIRRELVQWLAVNDARHSRLHNALPRRLAEETELVAECLADVAVYRMPSGTDMGRYTLRPEAWSELDLYYPRWNKSDLQHAVHRYEGIFRKSAVVEQLPRWKEPYPGFHELYRILHTPQVAAMLRSIVHQSILGTGRATDALVIVALHTLALAISTTELMVAPSSQTSQGKSTAAGHPGSNSETDAATIAAGQGPGKSDSEGSTAAGHPTSFSADQPSCSTGVASGVLGEDSQCEGRTLTILDLAQEMFLVAEERDEDSGSGAGAKAGTPKPSKGKGKQRPRSLVMLLLELRRQLAKSWRGSSNVRAAAAGDAAEGGARAPQAAGNELELLMRKVLDMLCAASPQCARIVHEHEHPQATGVAASPTTLAPGASAMRSSADGAGQGGASQATAASTQGVPGAGTGPLDAKARQEAALAEMRARQAKFLAAIKTGDKAVHPGGGGGIGRNAGGLCGGGVPGGGVRVLPQWRRLAATVLHGSGTAHCGVVPCARGPLDSGGRQRSKSLYLADRKAPNWDPTSAGMSAEGVGSASRSSQQKVGPEGASKPPIAHSDSSEMPSLVDTDESSADDDNDDADGSGDDRNRVDEYPRLRSLAHRVRRGEGGAGGSGGQDDAVMVVAPAHGAVNGEAPGGPGTATRTDAEGQPAPAAVYFVVGGGEGNDLANTNNNTVNTIPDVVGRGHDNASNTNTVHIQVTGGDRVDVVTTDNIPIEVAGGDRNNANNANTIHIQVMGGERSNAANNSVPIQVTGGDRNHASNANTVHIQVTGEQARQQPQPAGEPVTGNARVHAPPAYWGNYFEFATDDAGGGGGAGNGRGMAGGPQNAGGAGGPRGGWPGDPHGPHGPHDPATRHERVNTLLEDVGVQVMSCGHMCHVDCMDRYFTSLVQRHSQNELYQGANVINLEAGEFLCPLCRRIANCLLPAIPEPVARRLVGATPSTSLRPGANVQHAKPLDQTTPLGQGQHSPGAPGASIGDRGAMPAHAHGGIMAAGCAEPDKEEGGLAPCIQGDPRAQKILRAELALQALAPQRHHTTDGTPAPSCLASPAPSTITAVATPTMPPQLFPDPLRSSLEALTGGLEYLWRDLGVEHHVQPPVGLSAWRRLGLDGPHAGDADRLGAPPALSWAHAMHSPQCTADVLVLVETLAWTVAAAEVGARPASYAALGGAGVAGGTGARADCRPGSARGGASAEDDAESQHVLASIVRASAGASQERMVGPLLVHLARVTGMSRMAWLSRQLKEADKQATPPGQSPELPHDMVFRELLRSLLPPVTAGPGDFVPPSATEPVVAAAEPGEMVTNIVGGTHATVDAASVGILDTAMANAPSPAVMTAVDGARDGRAVQMAAGNNDDDDEMVAEVAQATGQEAGSGAASGDKCWALAESLEAATEPVLCQDLFRVFARTVLCWPLHGAAMDAALFDDLLALFYSMAVLQAMISCALDSGSKGLRKRAAPKNGTPTSAHKRGAARKRAAFNGGIPAQRANLAHSPRDRLSPPSATPLMEVPGTARDGTTISRDTPQGLPLSSAPPRAASSSPSSSHSGQAARAGPSSSHRATSSAEHDQLSGASGGGSPGRQPFWGLSLPSRGASSRLVGDVDAVRCWLHRSASLLHPRQARPTSLLAQAANPLGPSQGGFAVNSPTVTAPSLSSSSAVPSSPPSPGVEPMCFISALVAKSLLASAAREAGGGAAATAAATASDSSPMAIREASQTVVRGGDSPMAVRGLGGDSRMAAAGSSPRAFTSARPSSLAPRDADLSAAALPAASHGEQEGVGDSGLTDMAVAGVLADMAAKAGGQVGMTEGGVGELVGSPMCVSPPCESALDASSDGVATGGPVGQHPADATRASTRCDGPTATTVAGTESPGNADAGTAHAGARAGPSGPTPPGCLGSGPPPSIPALVHDTLASLCLTFLRQAAILRYSLFPADTVTRAAEAMASASGAAANGSGAAVATTSAGREGRNGSSSGAEQQPQGQRSLPAGVPPVPSLAAAPAPVVDKGKRVMREEEEGERPDEAFLASVTAERAMLAEWQLLLRALSLPSIPSLLALSRCQCPTAATTPLREPGHVHPLGTGVAAVHASPPLRLMRRMTSWCDDVLGTLGRWLTEPAASSVLDPTVVVGGMPVVPDASVPAGAATGEARPEGLVGSGRGEQVQGPGEGGSSVRDAHARGQLGPGTAGASAPAGTAATGAMVDAVTGASGAGPRGGRTGRRSLVRRVVGGGPLVPYVRRPHRVSPVQLLQLPFCFHDLFQLYVSRRCHNCQTVPERPALCLLCGTLACANTKCCAAPPSARTHGRHRLQAGECFQHAHHCGARLGVFLLLKSTGVLLLRCERACLWPSPYLDAHGEEDVDLKRGKPLYLNAERYEMLTTMVAKGSMEHNSVVLARTVRRDGIVF
eukprot:jgi/Mesvir1/24280/Mv10978-RA.1